VSTDYYEILGVDHDAAPEEIKRAYRRLAREHHPDVAGNDGSEERFKEVSRAYEVLSNPEKRRIYDSGVDPAAPNGGGFGAGFGFQDIFETFFGGGPSARRGPVPRARRGQDALVRLDVELADAAFGTHREVQVDTAVLCPTCQGGCCRPGTSPRRCDTCGGLGSVQRVARSFLGQVMTSSPCAACHGFGTVIPEPCPECSGEGRVRSRRTLSVDVPAGVETGTRIKLPGQGEVGPAGGSPGDVYLEIRQRQHPTFVRQGDDLHCSIEIPMTAAALGTAVELETLDGVRTFDLRPGTQPDAVIVERGLGVGHLRGIGRGDLYVHVEVQVPTGLDEEQERLLRELAAARGEERPEARLASAQSGMFARLRDKLAGR
jgi:molecular chaperone DnaJ